MVIALVAKKSVYVSCYNNHTISIPLSDLLIIAPGFVNEVDRVVYLSLRWRYSSQWFSYTCRHVLAVVLPSVRSRINLKTRLSTPRLEQKQTMNNLIHIAYHNCRSLVIWIHMLWNILTEWHKKVGTSSRWSHKSGTMYRNKNHS